MGFKLKKGLSDEKIELMLGNVVASVEMEGMIVPNDEKEVLRKYAKGELTEKEVLEIIKNEGVERANQGKEEVL